MWFALLQLFNSASNAYAAGEESKALAEISANPYLPHVQYFSAIRENDARKLAVVESDAYVRRQQNQSGDIGFYVGAAVLMVVAVIAVKK